MRLISPSVKRSISPNVKILAAPVLIILVLVVLVISLIRIGHERITTQIQEYKEAKETQMALNEKLNVLRQVSGGLDADSTVIAIPDKNPGAWVISQTKTIAQENEVILGGLEIRKANEEGSLNKVEMSTTIQAQDYNNLIIFLQNLKSIAPVSTIDEVLASRSGSEGAVDGNLRMSFYWSALPTSLPPINEAISELTASEIEILSRISGLRFPSFTILNPSAPSERETPFN